MTVFIRIGLVILFLDELVVGMWNALAPESFYLNFPTVDLTPPFSEHYARDFGWATLGIAFLLLLAIITPKAHFVIPATVAYLIFGIPHFVFHVTELDDFTPGEAIALTVANAFVALLGIAVVLVTIARDRRVRRRRLPELSRPSEP